MSAADGNVTELLRAWSAGDAGARDRLMPLVCQDLRRRAAALFREAYLRLVDQRRAV